MGGTIIREGNLFWSGEDNKNLKYQNCTLIKTFKI